MMVPTSPQNSISVCQSRPLRASRDASIANTAPTRPSQIAASRRSKTRPVDAASRAAKIIVDDLDHGPAELPSTIGEPVLTAAALRVVQELIRRRLADVNEGAAAQVVSRDLRHRRPPRLPAPPRSRAAGLRPALPAVPSVRGPARREARPARTGPAECLRSCASLVAFSIPESE